MSCTLSLFGYIDERMLIQTTCQLDCNLLAMKFDKVEAIE
jgi:hypothetical protein